MKFVCLICLVLGVFQMDENGVPLMGLDMISWSDDSGYSSASIGLDFELISNPPSPAGLDEECPIMISDSSSESDHSESRSSVGEMLNHLADSDNSMEIAMMGLEGDEREPIGLPEWYIASGDIYEETPSSTSVSLDFDYEDEDEGPLEEENDYQVVDDDAFWEQLSPEEYEFEWSRVYGRHTSHTAGPVPLELLGDTYSELDMACLIMAHYFMWPSHIRPPISLEPYEAIIVREDCDRVHFNNIELQLELYISSLGQC